MSPDPSRRSALGTLAASALGALTVPALGGCGGPEPAIRSGRAPLRLWTHDPGYETTFTQAVKRSDIVGDARWEFTLDVTKASEDELVSRLITQAVASGDTPDLVGLVISEYPRLMGSRIAQNLLVDLSEMTDPQGEDLLRLDPYRVAGRPYALESDSSVSVLYYRQDLFAKHGIPEDFETWEELAEIGRRHHERTGQSLGMAATGDNQYVYDQFLQLLLQRGGLPFDDAGNLRIDSDEAVEVLEFMVDAVSSGFFIALPDPYGGAVASALKSSTLVATAMPDWYKIYGLQANVPEQQGRWRMRALPRFERGGHTASTLGGTGFAVVRDKETTRAALDLLRRVYLSREGQILRYESGGYLPTLRSLYEDPYFTGIEDDFLGGQPIFDVYRAAVDDLPTFYQDPSAQILADVAGGPILAALRGRTSPAAALRSVTTAYHGQVRR